MNQNQDKVNFNKLKNAFELAFPQKLARDLSQLVEQGDEASLEDFGDEIDAQNEQVKNKLGAMSASITILKDMLEDFETELCSLENALQERGIL